MTCTRLDKSHRTKAFSNPVPKEVKCAPLAGSIGKGGNGKEIPLAANNLPIAARLELGILRLDAQPGELHDHRGIGGQQRHTFSQEGVRANLQPCNAKGICRTPNPSAGCPLDIMSLPPEAALGSAVWPPSSGVAATESVPTVDPRVVCCDL